MLNFLESPKKFREGPDWHRGFFYFYIICSSRWVKIRLLRGTIGGLIDASLNFTPRCELLVTQNGQLALHERTREYLDSATVLERFIRLGTWAVLNRRHA
jgi:hypothetical protein